jgi:membrane protease YdiL (CAAX protease family)
MIHHDIENPLDADKLLSIYLLLVLILSAPFWVLEATINYTELPVNIPLSALATFNPMLVALFLVYRTHGLDAAKNLLRRPFDYVRIRQKIWYVPIFMLMPALMVLSYGLIRITGKTILDPYVPLLMTPFMFATFFIAAIGEEIGWQGYAFGLLNRRWNALEAGVILGVVWAAWHIIPYIQTKNSASWIVWQCVATVGLRVLIVWLYQNTGKSLFSAVAFHATINVSNFLFPNYGSYYDPFFASIVIWSTTLIIVAIWKPQTLTHQSKDADAVL